MFTAQNVPIGERFYLNVPLVISLGEDEPQQNFSVEVLPPEITGRMPIEGFENIPPEMFEVEGAPSIFVNKENPAVAKLYANFPNETEFLNRRFMVQLRIMPEGGTGNFQTAILANYLIETDHSSQTRTGGGPIAVAPSVLDFNGTSEAVVQIFNNDTIPHDIICSFSLPEAEPRGVAITYTPGFHPANPENFSIDSYSRRIDPGDEAEIVVSVNPVTNGEKPNRIEALLWIRLTKDKYGTRFVRLRFVPD